MSARSLILSGLIGGVIIAALSNFPLLNLANCLLCLWVWLGGIFAVWLYRRFEGRVTAGEGAAVGALAGLIAGAVGFIISLAGAAAMQGSFQAFAQVLPPDIAQSYNLTPGDFSRFGILVSCFSLLLFTGIGTLAGLLGAAIFRSSAPAPLGSVAMEPVPPPGGVAMPLAEPIPPVTTVEMPAPTVLPVEPAPSMEPAPPPEADSFVPQAPVPGDILPEPPAVPPGTSLEEPAPPKEPPPEPPA